MALAAVATYQRRPPGVDPLSMLMISLQCSTYPIWHGKDRDFFMIIEAANRVITRMCIRR
jgi:hypothetical protein